ncbi:hypothetical protein ACF9IK_02120 [Kitasatospora hibisci]|uniref:hypothetical protein n=1 Tax=Kitasatospora hibisci TaxID=3369522 RepID=UPI00375423CF
MSGDRRGAVETATRSERFAGLMAEAMAAAERFGHRQHVHLAWLAVRSHGTAAAVELVGEGIRGAALAAGAPEKYHATMTRAWVELVGRHASRAEGGLDGGADFDAFVDRHPELLDKTLPDRFYRTATLESAEARAAWVEPDLRPFPRQRADG